MAAATTSAPIFPASIQIPVDLVISKNRQGIPRGGIGFVDSSGNIVYKVHRQSSKSSAPPKEKKKKLLLDANENPLISMYRYDGGAWQGFKGDDGEEKDLLLFRVQRTIKTRTRIELEVFFDAENCGDSISDLKIKGSPFHRSCTIYKGDSIVAQTSLMYKLRQIYARRSRFRLTIFPGSIDHALVAALIVIFFDGRKYWN